MRNISNKVSHEVGKARGQQPGRCLLERKLKEEIERRSDSKDKQRKKERKKMSEILEKKEKLKKKASNDNK